VADRQRLAAQLGPAHLPGVGCGVWVHAGFPGRKALGNARAGARRWGKRRCHRPAGAWRQCSGLRLVREVEMRGQERRKRLRRHT
jgi:hypothetical protein